MLDFLRKCLDKLKPLSSSQPLLEVTEYIRPQDEFDKLIERWENLNPKNVSRVFSSDMSIYLVSLSKNKVTDYRRYFEMIISFFENEEMLKPVLTVVPVTTVYISDFFLDINSRYLDPHEEMRRLGEQVIHFLKHYQKGTNNAEPPFYISKNLSLTMHLVSEIDQLLKVFEQ